MSGGSALETAKVLADVIMQPSAAPYRICFTEGKFFEDALDLRGETKRVLRIVIQDVTEELKAQAETDLEAAYAGV